MRALALFLAGSFAVAALLGGGTARAEEAEQSQIDLANGWFSRGFYPEAADEYRAYLEAFPQGKHVTMALYRLGWSEYAEGNYEMIYIRDIKGASVGGHVVRITTENHDAGIPEKLPPQYHAETTLKAEVQPGSNEINFELTSR